MPSTVVLQCSPFVVIENQFRIHVLAYVTARGGASSKISTKKWEINIIKQKTQTHISIYTRNRMPNFTFMALL